ncbi:unannotated protein [freshwater metagenome]|uniref:Unannotated protein n=1 Tax=freshwater metagenome TaxID=449393 RepID=A0A6J6GXB4_9ZZZZ
MNQQGPCVGNAASCTGSAPGAVVVVAPPGAAVVVVTAAPEGRHTCIPGWSGLDAFALLACISAFIDTSDFCAIENHESFRTTV